MCHDDLSQADINAIGKNRGFDPQVIDNRATLANFYLSPVGVAEAFATLTPAEVAMLHLLHWAGEPVSLTWFERVYNPERKTNHYYGQTFTQRYQPIFKEVRTQLVRKGVLVMAQVPHPELTKMEQWRFAFPQAFAPYLPRPLPEIKKLKTPGEVRRDVPRNKLLALTGKVTPPLPALPQYVLSLRNGRIFSGDKPFRAADLQAWQQASWQHVMPTGTAYGERPSGSSDKFVMSPINALNYAFGLLQPDEWIAPQQLDILLKIFCLYQFDTEALCQLGWQWGYLAQNGVNGRFYYHLATTEPTSEPPPPAAYLSAADDKTVRINLQMIPYAALEQLNQIVEMQMDGGELTAVPHFARMGAAPPEMASLPLMSWLRDNVPAFAAAQKTIQSR